MFCKKCGKKLTDKQKFCTSCGAPLLGDENSKKTKTDSNETIFTKYSPPTHKSSWGVGRIITILIVLALIGIGAYNSLDEDSVTKNNEGLSSFDSGDSQTAINQLQQAKQDGHIQQVSATPRLKTSKGVR